jgi:hypothetical protein
MTTYTVNAGEGTTTGNNSSTTNTLNGAIYAADTGPVGNYIINITAGFTFSTDLLAINLPTGSTLTIQGTDGSGGAAVQTLNGGGQRGLFVYSGRVNVNNLTLTRACIQLGGARERNRIKRGTPFYDQEPGVILGIPKSVVE